MRATQVTETRTTRPVIVEVESLSYRDGRADDGMLLGPKIKITALAAGSARNYGFSSGKAFSLKEYGMPVRYVSEHAVVQAEGKNYKISDFFVHVLSL